MIVFDYNDAPHKRAAMKLIYLIEKFNKFKIRFVCNSISIDEFWSFVIYAGAIINGISQNVFGYFQNKKFVFDVRSFGDNIWPMWMCIGILSVSYLIAFLFLFDSVQARHIYNIGGTSLIKQSWIN